MILVVSDLHLGKDESTDEESLRQLASCIESARPDRVIFLGDVFDAFIDTGSDPPPPVERWSKLVKKLIANGCTITYLMGNHDRWHRGCVEHLIGEAPIRRSMILPWAGQKILLEHGDFGPSHGGSTSFARWLSDQPLIHRLYTTVLPFGSAQALAAAVSRKFSSFEPNPAAVKALLDHASDLVASSDVDAVIMGHCHQPGLFDLSDSRTGAWYMNSGDWYEHRTFILLDSDAEGDDEAAMARLCAWNEDRMVELDVHRVDNKMAT